jgi:hypothetical protein
MKNAIKHCRKYGKSVYLDIKAQEEALEHQSKVVSASMVKNCPNLSIKIILDQLNGLIIANSDGKLHEVDASLITPEENAAFTDVFNMMDSHGSNGITSVKSFVDKLASLTKVHLLEEKAYASLTEENLRKLFASEDPTVATHPVDADSVTIACFLKIMAKRPETVDTFDGNRSD